MRKKSKLIPEVLALLHEGRLHATDADWIGRLRPESQMAAAKKCMNGNPTFTPDRTDKSTIGNRVRGQV